MTNIENWIETTYPLASDAAKRAVRAINTRLRNLPLMSPSIIPTCEAYNKAVAELKQSHKEKYDSLYLTLLKREAWA